MSERTVNELYWTSIGYAILASLTVVILASLWILAPDLRRRWLPLPRLMPGAWTGRDVLLGFATLFFPVLVVVTLFQIGFFTPLIGPAPDHEVKPDDARAYGIRAGAIASPLSLAFSLGTLFMVLFARAGIRPHHFGLSWARWQPNVALGLAAAMAAAPLVLGLHALATTVLGEDSHPFTQFAKKISYDWEWIFFAFQLVVAAPILEEIVFRGVLLGWLRRASMAGHLGIMSASLLIAVARTWLVEPGEESLSFHPGPLVFALIGIGIYGCWMFHLTRRFSLADDEIQAWSLQDSRDPIDSEGFRRIEARMQAWREANAKLALFGSSLLFAIFHVEVWPAPIALFPLALVLGALAQRTQSLLGPIVMHAAFNFISFVALIGLTSQDPAKNGNAATTATRPLVAESIISSTPGSQLPLRK